MLAVCKRSRESDWASGDTPLVLVSRNNTVHALTGRGVGSARWKAGRLAMRCDAMRCDEMRATSEAAPHPVSQPAVPQRMLWDGPARVDSMRAR